MLTPTLGGWMVHVMRQADGALSLEEALHAIMESVHAYFPCQSVAVVLIDDDTNELRIKISRQISYTFAKGFRRSAPGPTIERVVLEQQPLLIAASDAASAVHQEIKLEHEFTSAVLAPIVRNQKGIGYVFCDRPASHPPFTNSDLLHLQVLGYLIGNLMQKFDLLRESKHLSQLDTVTGTLQYKAFVPALGVEFSRARSHDYPVTLCLLAVHAFRNYLETYGIDRAHALLAAVATVAKKHLRDMDLLARFGADQFIVCLAGLSREEAERWLSEVGRDVREALIGDVGQPTDVSVGAIILAGENDFRRGLQEVLGYLGKALVEAKATKSKSFVIGTLA